MQKEREEWSRGQKMVRELQNDYFNIMEQLIGTLEVIADSRGTAAVIAEEALKMKEKDAKHE